MKGMQRFKMQTRVAIVVQTHWRRHKADSSYRHLQKVAIVFQSSWRRIVAWKELGKLKMAAKVPKVGRFDLIGVDNFVCVFPYNLKIDIIWNSCLKKFKFERYARLLIYFKYLIRWRRRIQYLTIKLYLFIY